MATACCDVTISRCSPTSKGLTSICRATGREPRFSRASSTKQQQQQYPAMFHCLLLTARGYAHCTFVTHNRSYILRIPVETMATTDRYIEAPNEGVRTALFAMHGQKYANDNRSFYLINIYIRIILNNSILWKRKNSCF